MGTTLRQKRLQKVISRIRLASEYAEDACERIEQLEMYRVNGVIDKAFRKVAEGLIEIEVELCKEYQIMHERRKY